jgi:hypothetical protein
VQDRHYHLTQGEAPPHVEERETPNRDSQGLSADMVVLNPGKKRDFIPGLTYIAISRVRSLLSGVRDKGEALVRHGLYDIYCSAHHDQCALIIRFFLAAWRSGCGPTS